MGHRRGVNHEKEGILDMGAVCMEYIYNYFMHIILNPTIGLE